MLDETALGSAESRQHVYVPSKPLGQVEADADDFEGLLAVDLEKQVDVGGARLLAAYERAEHGSLLHRRMGAEYLADDFLGLGVVLNRGRRIIGIFNEIFQGGTSLNGGRDSILR